MTAPDSPSSSLWPPEPAPAPAPSGIRAADGNRAALMLLVVQNIVSVLMMGTVVNIFGVPVRVGFWQPLGISLLVTFLATLAVGWLMFRPSLQALARDARWRTPPSWGTALGAFGLGFIASRAIASAYIMLVPSAASSVPQFLSHGPDLWILVLAAGVLIPFAEEVAFRGLMMRGQERAAGFMVAAVATSLAFGIAHGVPATIAGIVPLAYVLARVVQHSGSLWNSVIVHALNNLVSVGLGAFLAGKNLTRNTEAIDLIKNESLRLPLAGGSLLFGVAVLVITHHWLTPKPDPQVESARGPWLSAAYVVILLFGAAVIALGLPAVQRWFTHLHGILQ